MRPDYEGGGTRVHDGIARVAVAAEDSMKRHVIIVAKKTYSESGNKKIISELNGSESLNADAGESR